jgi:hypothetical protein
MAMAFDFPWFVDKYGVHAGFFTYAGICLVATVFFWALVPETKGKSLEEIERHWLAGCVPVAEGEGSRNLREVT